MTTTKQKKLNLYKYLGAMLLDKGKAFLKLAFSVKITSVMRSQDLNNMLKKIGVGSWLADNKYYLTDIETWKDIIKYDWTDKRKYLEDRGDCDNYSGTFHARMAEIYGLNTAGDAKSIDITDKDTGKHLFWHRANVIVATDKGVPKLYAYEPQTDEIAELTGKSINLRKNWIYNFRLIEYN